MEPTSHAVATATPAPLPECMAASPLFLLAKAHMLAHELGARAIEPFGLTLKHYGCLKVVAAEGPVSQQALGELMRVDRTTIVTLVDELEQSGFVLRRRNPTDRRAYALEATTEGREWLAAAGDAVASAENETFRRFVAGERAQLVELLRKLLGH